MRKSRFTEGQIVLVLVPPLLFAHDKGNSARSYQSLTKSSKM